MGVRLLSRVTTTRASPSSARVNSGARMREFGTGVADELGTGVVLQAATPIVKARSQPSLIRGAYRQGLTRRNAPLSYICRGAALAVHA